LTQRFQPLADGVRFRVRLTPKGGRDAVEGWAAASDGCEHLKARVRAVPENGAANAALLALLAGALGVARSALVLEAGGKARLKTVRAVGDTAALAARLNGWGP